MTKQFEDYFSEIQADMVAICLEYVRYQADDIYIYCSYEANMYAFDVFFKIQGIFIRKHKLNEISEEYDASIERQDKLLDIGIKNLESIYEKCKEFDRDMPTEIKLHYNVKKNRLTATYKYELVYSNDDNLLPDHIFDQWFEEVKKEMEK